MHIEKGSPQDTRDIARLYCAAFPASVELFFRGKPREKLLDLLELTFDLIFAWGGEALLARSTEGAVLGYCMYFSPRGLLSRRKWDKMVATAGSMMGKVGLLEAGRLLRNQVMMTLSTRHTKKVPTPRSQARILSIAIDPSSQGKGVGTLLLQRVLEKLEHQGVVLNVRKDNPAGRNLYARAGFQECGFTRDLSGEWIMLFKEPTSY